MDSPFDGYREGPHPRLTGTTGLMSARWAPWTRGPQPMERCKGHTFPASERAETILVDGVHIPNPWQRSHTELTEGPLVLSATMVNGQCRQCHEGGKARGPVHRDQRAPEPPAQLFDAPEPAVRTERWPEDEGEAIHGFDFRAPSRRKR